MDRRDEEAQHGSWYKFFDKVRMTITVEIYGEDEDCDEKIEITFPAKFEVCTLCDGKGTHVNPSIDAHGITGSEMEELGDEFREDYFNGTYDESCYRCDSQRVEPLIDESNLSSEEKKNLDTFETEQRDEAQWRAESEAERLMGC